MGGLFGGGKQQWVWFLPDTEGAQGAQTEHLQGETLKVLKNTEDAQQKKVSTFKNIEHLQAADTHDSAIVVMAYFHIGFPWLKDHLAELLAAGWTRRELFGRGRYKWPVGNWGGGVAIIMGPPV